MNNRGKFNFGPRMGTDEYKKPRRRRLYEDDGSFKARWRERGIIYPQEFWPDPVCNNCTTADSIEFFRSFAFVGAPTVWHRRCTRCVTYRDVGQLHCSYPEFEEDLHWSVLADHVIPASKGGALVVPSCHKHNEDKSGELPGLKWILGGSEIIFLAAQEAHRVKGTLEAVLSMALDQHQPDEVVTQIGSDIGWWTGYLTKIERGGTRNVT